MLTKELKKLEEGGKALKKNLNIMGYNSCPVCGADPDIQIPYIKDLLKAQRQDIIEEIKGMKKDFTVIITTDGSEAMTTKEWRMKGYNQALDDLLERLETK